MTKQSGAETLAMKNKIYMTIQESVIGAGTGNYNKLANVPIVNLVGSDEDHVVDLSGISPGVFMLSGFYKIEHEQEEPDFVDKPIQVNVVEETTEDEDGEVTTKKILYYIFVKGKDLYARMLIYVNNELESDETVCLTSVSGEPREEAEFIVVELLQDNWSEDTVEDGGRNWYTYELPIVSYAGKMIHAIPCGETVDVMLSAEKESFVFSMKAYLYEEDMKIVFYAPAVPEWDVTVGLQGIKV